MAQPIWVTNPGDLGTYPTNILLSIPLNAYAVNPAGQVAYELVSGYFPEPVAGTLFKIDPLSGLITGTPQNIPVQATYQFTIRAIDNLNNISDRTFSFTLVGSNGPMLTIVPGELLRVVDSTYVNLQLQYNNPITNNPVNFIVVSGILPPGLQLLDNGTIVGYPKPPYLSDNSPTITSYSFTVQLYSDLGSDTQTYSITIVNQELSNPPQSRPPAILNTQPLSLPIPINDSFYSYYVGSDNRLPDITTGDYFSFKILGHDFDGNGIKYTFFTLPPGLTGDTTTGWITGTPILPAVGIVNFNFSVTVSKNNNNFINSGIHRFSITVNNQVPRDLTWVTGSNLGSINNGSISELFVQASSAQTLNYRIAYGNLPLNLQLLPTGELAGRVAEQPTSKFLKSGTIINYNFGITAYSVQYPLLQITQNFTLQVTFTHDVPLENVYIKALCSLSGRKVIQSLLTDETIIPSNLLYRPDDIYFGKATDVRFTHLYGMYSNYIDNYLTAMANHYTRTVVLGEIKTAIARDSNFNIIYEVVYSEIIDDLVNPDGTSIPNQIAWPRNILVNPGKYEINNSTISISSTNYKTNNATNVARILNPESLSNMRQDMLNSLPHDNDISLLPQWMTSQQTNGDVLGYLPAWIICYALPGQGATIQNNIVNNWTHKLNEIQFIIDRYIVDKSYSYNYNNRLQTPSWQELPSANPVPNPLDRNDLTIFFPKNTILPNS